MADQPKRTSRGTFAPGSSGNPTGKQNAAVPARRTRLDGWTNIFTGHGVYGRDKRQGTSFTAATLNFDQLVELWRGDDLAARAVEVWPKEATRAGWDLTIPEAEGGEDESDRITQITEKLHDLGADVLIRQALATERGMGGAAILIGANDGQTDLTQPLNLAKVRSLDWLTHLEPREIVPVYGYADPRAPKYGQPEIYRIVPRTVFPPAGGTYSQQTIDVHESRLLIFPGIKVSRYQNMTTQAGWGDSVLIRMWRVLRDFNLAWGSAGTLVTTFASGIWKMKDLWEVLGSKDGAQTFAERLLAMDQAMSTVNATVIDGDDDYHREQTPISGLPDLMDRFATRLAAAADMPLTLLFGTSPAGLNATGESDIRFFYDRVSAYQHDKIEPQLRQLIRILFLCTGSKTEPDKWDIQFRPLWQESSADKAKAQLTQAQADHIWITDQVVSPEEVAKSHWGTGKWNPDLSVDFDARDDQEAAASGPVRPEDMIMLGRQYTPPPNGPTQASQGTTGPGPAAPPDPNTPPRPIVLTDDAGHRVQLVMGWRRDSDDESQFRADAAKDDVVDQLKDDYGYDDMKWVRDAMWNGPQRVPLDSVDYSGETGWRATQEPDKVEKFQDKIQKGWEKPIILVKRPGHDKYMIADGHHRALAYRNAGRGPLAYVTHTATNEGPWDTFHDHQRAKRNDSAERFEVFSGWDRYELRPMLVRVDDFHPDQPRDENGRWSGGGASAGAHELAAKANAHGGFTYDPSSHRFPEHGYAVSVHPGHEEVIKAKDLTPEAVHGYVARHGDVLKKPGAHLGGWYDPEAGKWYLDVSHVTPDRAEAEHLAKAHNQEAYFDLGKHETVYVKSGKDRRIDGKQATTTGRAQDLLRPHEDDTGGDPRGHETPRAGGARAAWHSSQAGRVDDFHPDEPRDQNGQWTGGGASAPRGSASGTTEHGGSHEGAKAEEWKAANPHGNADVFNAAKGYLQKAGLPPLKVLSHQSLSADEGRKIADSYDHAKDDPSDPHTQAAYHAFNSELAAQRAAAEAAGYKFEAWTKAGQPYANSKEMMKDVQDNHHLYYFKSTQGTVPNQLMSLEQNDTFRAVHDLYGHAMGGNQFGPKGETNAFLDHVQMFTPVARQALATETLGQNAWFNFSRANEGKSVTERKFADQKAFLLDPKLYQPVIDRSLVPEHKDAADEEETDLYGACPCHRHGGVAHADTWSDAAREASIESRRAHAKQPGFKKPTPGKPSKTAGGGIHTGERYTGKAGEHVEHAKSMAVRARNNAEEAKGNADRVKNLKGRVAQQRDLVEGTHNLASEAEHFARSASAAAERTKRIAGEGSPSHVEAQKQAQEANEHAQAVRAEATAAQRAAAPGKSTPAKAANAAADAATKTASTLEQASEDHPTKVGAALAEVKEHAVAAREHARAASRAKDPESATQHAAKAKEHAAKAEHAKAQLTRKASDRAKGEHHVKGGHGWQDLLKFLLGEGA